MAQANVLGRLISIVMPAYNCEKTIGQSIESVVSQTFSNWELLIVDDGSTDKTRSVAEEWQKKDERIRLLCNPENLGVSETRNYGVRQAKGEWIAFLDSDDLWTADKLEKQLAFLADCPEAKLIFTASAFMDENGVEKDYILHVPRKIQRKQLLKQNVISCSSVLVTRDYMQAFPFCGERLAHEDFVTWLLILKNEKYAYGIDEPLLIYRVSANSKSGNKWKALKMQWNAYQKAGIGFFPSVYNMAWYGLNGVIKYSRIKFRSNK